ncbi:MAG: hypothetical protein K2P58_03450 [Hyphomonadaceae bacterium]|nr:hypothetical protein [Hyphomonadaceae bacterium]
MERIMQTNRTPAYDASDSPTGCCPHFKPQAWDGQARHFEDKLFARAKTHSAGHIPLDMGAVFARTQEAIDAAHAQAPDQTLVLSSAQPRTLRMVGGAFLRGDGACRGP